VNADCTGTVTLKFYEGAQLVRTSVLSTVTDNNGREIRMVQRSLQLPNGAFLPAVITVGLGCQVASFRGFVPGAVQISLELPRCKGDERCAGIERTRGLQLGRLCGNCLPLEFRHTYTPATDSIPPGSSHIRKEDL
jgi:hypothetical protein